MPNQAAGGGGPTEIAADGGRTGQGVGGETAYARMLMMPGPRASAKRIRPEPTIDHDGDSMWPIMLLVLAMIGTAVVASSRYLAESEAVQPKMARLATGTGAALPTDRAEIRTQFVARGGAATRLTVRSAEADLRAEPSPRADVLASLRRGQTVLPFAAADEWTGVRLPGPGGAFGWVRSSLLGRE